MLFCHWCSWRFENQTQIPWRNIGSFCEAAKRRRTETSLKERSTESDDKINMRIAKASVELATAPQFDTIIKNYDLDIALEEAYQLVKEFVKK